MRCKTLEGGTPAGLRVIGHEHELDGLARGTAAGDSETRGLRPAGHLASRWNRSAQCSNDGTAPVECPSLALPGPSAPSPAMSGPNGRHTSGSTATDELNRMRVGCIAKRTANMVALWRLLLGTHVMLEAAALHTAHSSSHLRGRGLNMLHVHTSCRTRSELEHLLLRRPLLRRPNCHGYRHTDLDR